MRITNKMMTNNALSNINRNKNKMNTVSNQKATGLKIQRASEDPIIAVRALRFRSNLSQLTQYVEKNVPDAFSWMSNTETALDAINGTYEEINKKCIDGATGTKNVYDCLAIVQEIKEKQEEIYKQGNSDYAGRYLFTGYKTDTPLLFQTNERDIDYEITQNMSSADFKYLTFIDNSIMDNKYDDNPEPDNPTLGDVHRIRLAYGELDENVTPTIEYKDTSGATIPLAVTSTVSVNDPDAYKIAPDEVRFIPETGEIIFGDDIYKEMRYSSNIDITYNKSTFQKGDLRPEHYFDCISTDNGESPPKVVNYVKENQEIQYEVNFGQKLTVNTQIDATFTHDIGRDVEDLMRAVQDAIATQEKIDSVKKMIEDPMYSSKDDQEKLEGMLKKLEIEFSLKQDLMYKSFQDKISTSKQYQDKVSITQSNLGSRWNRLELTENRLSSQQIDFEELLSNNEEVDIADVIVKYNTLDAIYTSSLSVGAKVVKNSLLDFL